MQEREQGKSPYGRVHCPGCRRPIRLRVAQAPHVFVKCASCRGQLEVRWGEESTPVIISFAPLPSPFTLPIEVVEGDVRERSYREPSLRKARRFRCVFGRDRWLGLPFVITTVPWCLGTYWLVAELLCQLEWPGAFLFAVAVLPSLGGMVLVWEGLDLLFNVTVLQIEEGVLTVSVQPWGLFRRPTSVPVTEILSISVSTGMWNGSPLGLRIEWRGGKPLFVAGRGFFDVDELQALRIELEQFIREESMT